MPRGWIARAAAAVLLCVPCAARGEPAAYETRVNGPRVRRSVPADDLSGFSTVLELRDPLPGRDLGDLLEEVPGLRVRDQGPGGRRLLSLRGAEPHQVAVYLDGVRLNAAGMGGVDLSLFDPAHLERAEVRRSAGSARFGSDALGGALLLSTPQLRRRGRTSLAAGYGSYRSVQLRGSHGGARGELRYLVSGSYRDLDGTFPFRDDNGVARVRENNDGRQGEVLAKVDHPLGDRWMLGVLDTFSVSARGAPGMSQRPSPTARQFELRNLSLVRGARHGVFLPGGVLSLSAHHRYGRFAFDETSAPPVVAQADSHAVGAGLELAVPLPGVGRVEGGLELRGDLYRDTQTVASSERLSFDARVGSQLELWGRRVVFAPMVRVAAASAFETVVVPRLGVALRPFRSSAHRWLAGVEFLGNLGRSFRHPTFQEMFIRVDGFGGNPELRPEDALGGDLGLRWRGPWLAFEAAYFRRYLKNVILFAPVSSFLVRPDNYGGVTSQGLESAVELAPGAGLALRTAYTFCRSRFGTPEMSLPGQPEHRWVARLSFSGARLRRWLHARGRARHLEGLKLWGGATVESGMVLARFDSQPEEGRVILSAGGAYTYRFLTFAAEGQNLLDKRDAVDAVGFPLAPARLFVSLAASF